MEDPRNHALREVAQRLLTYSDNHIAKARNAIMMNQIDRACEMMGKSEANIHVAKQCLRAIADAEANPQR